MRSRAAFTLIELLMVVLVVGVLAAVAIPTYSGQRDRAEAASVTSNLETVLRSARAEYTKNDGTYPAAAAIAAAAATDNPAFTVGASANFTPGVQVEVPDAQRVVIRTRAPRQQANEMIVDDRTVGSEQTARLHGYRDSPGGLPTVVNETINPNLESGTLGHWSATHNRTAVAASALSLETAGCREGRYCARISATGGGGAGSMVSQIVAICNGCTVAQMANLDTVAPGDKLATRCSLKVLDGQVGRVAVAVQPFNASGAKMAGPPGNGIDEPEVGRWYDVEQVTDPVATATAVAAALRVNVFDVTGDANVLVDRCMLVVNPPEDRQPAYFDGSTGGGRWTGTANLSRSEGYLARRTSSDD